MNTESKSAKQKGKLSSFEPYALMVYDIAATFIAVFVASWGTQHWATFSGAAGACPAIAVLAVINVIVFWFFHMYSSLWRYASISEAGRIVAAVTVGSIIGDVIFSALFGKGMSFREDVMAWAILVIICGGGRFGIRAIYGSQAWRFKSKSAAHLPRTLIVGAGETGSLTIKRMLSSDPDMVGDPVAVVDDDPNKQGQRIHDIKVYGTCADIPNIARDCEAEQIVVAVPSSTFDERQRIYDLCMQTGIRVLTLPNVRDIPVSGLGRVALREVEISDLLSREEKSLDLNQMGYVTGKRILVTGGGGSIGSELVRQLLPAKPAQIVLFDIYENTTYELYHDIIKDAREQGTDIQVYIGSITHIPAITKVFEKYHPQVVFHAAAHKHVPLMEHNACEAIENNVFGTLNVVKLADKYNCSHFVQISTDKAVNPANVMGATKRMDEMIVQYYAANSKTIFTAVRFGNVLGSHGSVIPLFKRQLREGGPITITHKDITRYFMTIPEASKLVITAGALAHGGEIFVLDMGEPVKIYDLAINLITLSGLKPGKDVEIKEVGLRPGEKMYEELLMDNEQLLSTEHSEIRISTAEADRMEEIKDKLEKLKACLNESNDEIKTVLSEVVPTYHPQYND